MAGYIGNYPTAVPLTGADLTDGIITSAKIADGTISSTDVNYPLTTFSSTGIDDNATSTTVTLDNNGILLVGKTTTGVSGVGTELRNGVTNYCLIGTSSSEATLLLNRTTSTGDIARFRYNNTGVGDISVTASSTSYNTSSDYRLKENVSYDFDATTRLKQLKPARFNFISDANTTVDGFIAHEVSSIVPEAINGEKDAINEDGSIKPQSIDQSKLVPILTKALQEAVNKIETLEARITALENA